MSCIELSVRRLYIHILEYSTTRKFTIIIFPLCISVCPWVYMHVFWFGLLLHYLLISVYYICMPMCICTCFGWLITSLPSNFSLSLSVCVCIRACAHRFTLFRLWNRELLQKQTSSVLISVPNRFQVFLQQNALLCSECLLQIWLFSCGNNEKCMFPSSLSQIHTHS